MTIPKPENPSTENPSSNVNGEYHILFETADILYSYSDTRVLARYPTLAAANAAAKDALRQELLEELDVVIDDEEEDVVESFRHAGERVLGYSSEDLDFTVEVKFIPAPSEAHEEVGKRVFTAFKQVDSHVEMLGVFRQEEKANARAEMELRREAGIRSWRDRRRWKMGMYSEVYDMETGFEGVWCGERQGVVRVWVRGCDLK
ncbi:hypothetical protein FN846DRAFT_108922 [Sphaerosporella brunnea]|uniref:Uncharacterized protein n=1 Tax=Sphaerosporella brunnea TaxID=1250544 RepID=A0A5J5ET53_9PEZI|nr:hypothetical protein FN846DRAFT_108922 [Sphaerosporella brunnea]